MIANLSRTEQGNSKNNPCSSIAQRGTWNNDTVKNCRCISPPPDDIPYWNTRGGRNRAQCICNTSDGVNRPCYTTVPWNGKHLSVRFPSWPPPPVFVTNIANFKI